MFLSFVWFRDEMGSWFFDELELCCICAERKSYHYIEVTVHHDGSPASEVNIFLPPVTYLEDKALFSLQACDQTKTVLEQKSIKNMHILK